MIESHLARGRGEPEAIPVLDVSARGFTPSYQGELRERRGSGPFTVPQLTAPLDGPSTQFDSVPASHSRSREIAPVAPGGRRRRVPVIAGFAAAAAIAGAIVCAGRSGSDGGPGGSRAQARPPVAVAPAPSAGAAPAAPGPSAPPPAPERLTKELSFGERKMLDTARGLLIKELAIAKGVGEDKISGEIDAIFAPAAA